MLILGAIVVVLVGGVAFAARPAVVLPRKTGDLPPMPRSGKGGSTEGAVLPKTDNTAADAAKAASTALALAASTAGLIKGILGGAGAATGTVATVGATGGAAAGGGGAAAGISAGPAALFVVAVGAAVMGTALIIMGIVKDIGDQQRGAFGYLTQELLVLANATTEARQAHLLAQGVPFMQARAAGKLAGFYTAVGYNRAALAYVVLGAPREVVFGVTVQDPFRHLGYYVARAMCLPDEQGLIWKFPLDRPAGWVGAWPHQPILDGRPFAASLEELVFDGGLTLGQARNDAGAHWNEEFEQACDFIGRAKRCSFQLHNKWLLGGQAIAVPSTIGAVRDFCRLGMIGLKPLGGIGAYPPGAEVMVIDDGKVSGAECVHQIGGGVAWYFNDEMAGPDAKPIRMFV